MSQQQQQQPSNPGNNPISMEKFNAVQEIPVMHSIGQEHLKQCRACCERTARHHLNVEPVLTDVQVMQQAELSMNILQHVNEYFEERKVWEQRENKIVYIAGLIVGMVVSTLGNVLAQLIG